MLARVQVEFQAVGGAVDLFHCWGLRLRIVMVGPF